MALARVKVWVAETLTYSDLNAEFDSILNNPGSLICPITFHLTFTDATYDIGASGATRPRDLYLSRNATVGGNVSVTGTGTFTGGATITGLAATRASNIPITCDRTADDGTLVSLRQDSVEEGTISVSGTTVSYNAFLGSHWSQFEDGSKPDILRGTLMETIDQMCEWQGEANEKLPRCKVSDTAGSERIYGVFLAWDDAPVDSGKKDENGEPILVPPPTNDLYVAAVGSFIVRVNKDVVVANGDLLESNGDGTARVQSDNIVRASTVAKVLAAVRQATYEDGSYTVPCVFFNG